MTSTTLTVLAPIADRTVLASPGHLKLLPAPASPPRTPTQLRALDAELRALFGRRRTPSSALPPPHPRAAAAVRILLEVAAGDRPTRQVAGWVSPRVMAGLDARPPARRRATPRGARVRSLHVSEPSNGVAEVVAVVTMAGRCRALALRLEGLDGRWVVTALELC